jgi:hypothetical protein
MTKRGKLIGIVGYAGSGKTTITRDALITPFTQAMFLTPIVQMNFSSPIIAMLSAMGIPSELLDDKSRWNEPLDMLCGHSIRYAATTLGTEWGRDHIGQDVWTRIALARSNEYRAIGQHVIIDNVRFPSEMDAMREADAVFVAMLRPGLHDGTVKHQSEFYIRELQEPCEYEINNNGTFKHAVAQMRKIIVDIIDA